MRRVVLHIFFCAAAMLGAALVYASDPPSRDAGTSERDAGSIYIGKEPLSEKEPGPSGGAGTVQRDSGMPAEYFQGTKTRLSSFFEAALQNDYETVRRHILEGVDINSRDEFGNTALHMAQDARIVILLIQSGADVNARDTEFGMTPVFNKSKDAALALIEAGADVNARSKKGNTPLLWYAYNGYLDGIKLLLDHGADITACNDDGKGALDVAEEFAGADVVNFLRSKGARPGLKK